MGDVDGNGHSDLTVFDGSTLKVYGWNGASSGYGLAGSQSFGPVVWANQGFANSNGSGEGTPPGITSSPSSRFIVGARSTFAVIATGSPKPTITESGKLPTGVSFAGGVLSGIPAAGTAATYPITITASNGIEPNAAQKFTLTVLSIAITTSSLPAGKVGAKYSTTLKAVGGNPPYTWSLATGSKPLPPGLKLSSAGVISGMPTKKGSYSFTVKIVDTKTKTKPPVQHTATATFTISVS